MSACEKIWYVAGPTIKILDINESDTNRRLYDISAHVPLGCCAIAVHAIRIGGTGYMTFWSGEIVNSPVLSREGYQSCVVGIKPGLQRFLANQSVANDDFDVVLIGYWVQPYDYGGV